MKLNKILKPKSPKEILRTFAINNNIDMYQLEEFLKIEDLCLKLN